MHAQSIWLDSTKRGEMQGINVEEIDALNRCRLYVVLHCVRKAEAALELPQP